MDNNALSALNPDAKTTKRAQYEGFEFTIEAPARVRVTNASYGDDAADHSYLVTIEDGVPTACECPSDEYRPGACKHRVAVAIRRPIMDAAGETETIRADGGAVLPPEPRGGSLEDTTPSGCPHDYPRCEGVDADRDRPELCFPCWREWA